MDSRQAPPLPEGLSFRRSTYNGGNSTLHAVKADGTGRGLCGGPRWAMWSGPVDLASVPSTYFCRGCVKALGRLEAAKEAAGLQPEAMPAGPAAATLSRQDAVAYALHLASLVVSDLSAALRRDMGASGPEAFKGNLDRAFGRADALLDAVRAAQEA